MLEARDDAPGDNSRQLTALFAGMWATFVLFHVGSHYSLPALFGNLAAGRPIGYGHGGSLWTLLLVVAAFVALVRPQRRMLALLCGLQLADVITRSPFVSNHWLFAGLQAVAVLGCLAYCWARQRDDAFWPWFSRTARLSVYALYTFVVVHKLNGDYWNIDSSCGTYFWSQQQIAMPFLPDGERWWQLAMVSGVSIEALIPLLLFFSRTRLVGALVLAGFHGVIGFSPISGFYNFSSMLFAMTICFIGPALLAGGAAICARAGVARTTVAVGARVLPMALFLPLLFLPDFTAQRLWLMGIWAIYGVLFCAWILATIILTERPAPARETPMPRALLAGPLCVVLLGAGPYIGHRFEGSFAMFSNLRVEGGHWNHLFLPSALQYFTYMQDVLHVADASVATIGITPGRWTTFELRRHLPGATTPWIDVVESGGIRRIHVGHERPDLLVPLPRWQEKLMWFRTTPVTAVQPCVH